MIEVEQRLAILGASGHGKVVADIAECCGWQHIDFFDDAWSDFDVNEHWEIIGDTAVLVQALSQYSGVIVAIGDNRIRAAKFELLLKANAQMISLIHPDTVISRYSSIGVGSVVMAGVVVNIDTTIAEGAILNTGCSIDHDCSLGCFVHVSPGARLAGNVSVGDESWIGIGATVRQSIAISSKVMVGAGAAVVNDLPSGVTALGVPAKITTCL